MTDDNRGQLGLPGEHVEVLRMARSCLHQRRMDRVLYEARSDATEADYRKQEHPAGSTRGPSTCPKDADLKAMGSLNGVAERSDLKRWPLPRARVYATNHWWIKLGLTLTVDIRSRLSTARRHARGVNRADEHSMRANR